VMKLRVPLQRGNSVYQYYIGRSSLSVVQVYYRAVCCTPETSCLPSTPQNMCSVQYSIGI